MSLFDEIIQDIKAEYVDNPNKLGWRFLLTAKKTLEINNGILLITLNPGGSTIPPDHPEESCEDGCAFLTESWNDNEHGNSKLQKQIQYLFREISKKLNAENYKEVLNSSLCGYFIPFRSPEEKLLENRVECIKFSKKIWRKILANQRFKLIISLGNETYYNISKILSDILFYKLNDEQNYLVGWGEYTSTIAHYEKDGKKITLVRFPHLSRFSIFGRKESKEPINKIMTEAFRYIQI